MESSFGDDDDLSPEKGWWLNVFLLAVVCILGDDVPHLFTARFLGRRQDDILRTIGRWARVTLAAISLCPLLFFFGFEEVEWQGFFLVFDPHRLVSAGLAPVLETGNGIVRIVKYRFSPIVLLLTFISAIVVRKRSIERWRKREFLNTLNVSLNFFEKRDDGRLVLCFRTVREVDLSTLVNSTRVMEYLKDRGRDVPPDNPFVCPRESDSDEEKGWFSTVMTILVNTVSQGFSDGFVGYSIGLPVIRRMYVFGLTCEKYDDHEEYRKFRVILIDREALENFDRLPDTIYLESPFHAPRLECIKKMAELYAAEGGEQELVPLSIHEKPKRLVAPPEGTHRLSTLREVEIARVSHFDDEDGEGDEEGRRRREKEEEGEGEGKRRVDEEREREGERKGIGNDEKRKRRETPARQARKNSKSATRSQRIRRFYL